MTKTKIVTIHRADVDFITSVYAENGWELTQEAYDPFEPYIVCTFTKVQTVRSWFNFFFG